MGTTHFSLAGCLRGGAAHALAAGLVAASVLGCESNHYEIELKPQGDRIERRITVWRVRTGSVQVAGEPADARERAAGDREAPIVEFPASELARIADTYKKRLTGADAQKHAFVDEFTGRTPDDVGGAGSYTQFTTQMGTASLYVERFRGNDDLPANWKRGSTRQMKSSICSSAGCAPSSGKTPGSRRCTRRWTEAFAATFATWRSIFGWAVWLPSFRTAKTPVPN